jgi:murein DD-endopeptidase MepM/ murein hydrolase activator NlpD
MGYDPGSWRGASMGDQTPETPSHDPRTWIRPAVPTPPETTSFDPRTWAGAPAGPAAPAGKRSPPLALWIGVGLAALAVAAGGLWLATGRHAPAAGAAPASTGPAASALARRALVVARPGDIEAALNSAGVVPAEARSAAALAAGRLPAEGGDLTLVMMVTPGANGDTLASLEARRDSGASVVVERTAAGGFAARVTAPDVRTVVKVIRGEMNADSFYASALKQHLTDTLISPFAQALAFDFDFQRDVHAGDIFEAAFEDRVDSRGESVGAGRLLYVALETKAKSVALYWFQNPGGKPGWFDGNGRSTVRSLMRTPVDGARISSTFGMREHPILGFTKMHNGVDFAAPIGTPIYAAGDGVVQHAEMKALNGNYVDIQHANGWHTLYLHLNAFSPGVAAGARVRQGQEIGQVGITGRSTGPHLHYEVHVDNAPVDPMSLKMDAGPVLDGASLKAFFKERDRIDASRAAQTG